MGGWAINRILIAISILASNEHKTKIIKFLIIILFFCIKRFIERAVGYIYFFRFEHFLFDHFVYFFKVFSVRKYFLGEKC